MPDTLPPVGNRGSRVFCGGCDETVYEDCVSLRNHYIYFDPEGRAMVWYSIDFGTEVHRCRIEVADQVAARARSAHTPVLARQANARGYGNH